jgi:kelch-like protein 2/3
MSSNNLISFCFDIFREVVECEEFLTLSHQQVSKLICSDRLTVPSEEKV